MKLSSFSCKHCGSGDIRRSRGHSVREFAQMAAGTYPFRCLACNKRFSANLLSLSTMLYAKCPRCLRFQLTTWPVNRYRLGLWEKMLIRLGAHRYRCQACRCNFLSFLPRYEAPANLAAAAPSAEANRPS
jgi:DNA-directed RNA polymerase subunit RPC12/RpoP